MFAASMALRWHPPNKRMNHINEQHYFPSEDATLYNAFSGALQILLIFCSPQLATHIQRVDLFSFKILRDITVNMRLS